MELFAINISIPKISNDIKLAIQHTKFKFDKIFFFICMLRDRQCKINIVIKNFGAMKTASFVISWAPVPSGQVF